jgi:hypothetical protein
MPDDQNGGVPTTVKEVGIHIGYLRDDINEIKDMINKHIGAAVVRKELDYEMADAHRIHQDFEQRISRVEQRQEAREGDEVKLYKNITYIVACGLVMMLLAQYGIDKFFHP